METTENRLLVNHGNNVGICSQGTSKCFFEKLLAGRHKEAGLQIYFSTIAQNVPFRRSIQLDQFQMDHVQFTLELVRSLHSDLDLPN